MSENYIRVENACKGLKDLCMSLGREYRIIIFDFERVIYRDFGNGYEFEVSRLNTNKKKNVKGTIHIWKDKSVVIRSIWGIPREQIKEKLEELVSLMPVFEKEQWTLEEAVKCTGCSREQLLDLAQNESNVTVRDSLPVCFIRDELFNCTRYF